MTGVGARLLTDEARKAGLVDPRVIPYRKRNGMMAFKIMHGPQIKHETRPHVLIEATATIADAIKQLEDAAGG